MLYPSSDLRESLREDSESKNLPLKSAETQSLSFYPIVPKSIDNYANYNARLRLSGHGANSGHPYSSRDAEVR